MIRSIAKVGKNTVKADRAGWDELQRRLRKAIQGGTVRISSGGCEGMCDDFCEGKGGCDFTFGDPPECGGFCKNGEPWLQEEEA